MFLRQATFRLFGVARTSPIGAKLSDSQTAPSPRKRGEGAERAWRTTGDVRSGASDGAVRGARPDHLAELTGWRNKQHERDGGTAAPVFSLCRHRSKRPRLLIGGGRRCRRHITELGGRRRPGLPSRSRLLGARLLTPVPSVEQPESPESGERPGYPRPDVRDAARPFGTTPLIVAARIVVAGVRHDSTPFLVDQMLIGKRPTARNVPARDRLFPLRWPGPKRALAS